MKALWLLIKAARKAYALAQAGRRARERNDQLSLMLIRFALEDAKAETLGLMGLPMHGSWQARRKYPN